MKITCPRGECANVFDWEPPDDVPMMKMILASDIGKKEQKKPKRYSIRCPQCRRLMDITV